ncbi:MAG: DUF1801 domain-containing protein, partial [Gallionellaceae bacterium]|nr:DUF1801 domain-containing protein [Gallionellaceae bacterium]
MNTERIARLLEDIRLLSEDRYKLVQAVRKLALDLGGISEEVKYGGILFAAGKPFCGIFSYANHVSLEFSAGAALPDKHKVLEGDGKLRRHIKLVTIQDVKGKHVSDYLALAHKA